MRGQKGITLVALIITIIVLLILAVVSIGAINNSRIIDHSQNAADSWTAEQEHENTEIKNAEELMDHLVTNAKANQ